MADGVQSDDLRATGDRIEQLLDELRASAPPRVYARVEELLRLVTDLYGAGLARMLSLAASEPLAEHGRGLVEEIVADDLLASLLLVHDLHPESLAVRVGQALGRVRPLLAQHGGDVELVDVDPAAGAVRLRLLGTCDGCPSSSVTLQTAVERSVLEMAPEVVVIDVEEPTPAPVRTPVTLISKPEACPSEMAQL